MKLCLIGGDRRLLFLCEHLKEASHTVYYIGDGENALTPHLERAVSECDALILPTPMSRDGVFLSGSNLKIETLIAMLPEKTAVFGGRLDPRLHNGVRPLIDYFSDEAFTLRNALLTAEGVLRMVYESSEAAISDLSFLLYGYGRISTFLTSRLLALGARVTVVARKDSARKAAKALGAMAIDFSETPPEANYAVNTVPHPFAFSSLPPAKTLIDLAVLPKEAFPSGEAEVVSAPALPGKFFPKSAAKILYDTTIRKIGELSL